MENVLFVVNMQDMYVGRTRNKEKYSFNADDLIEKVNKRILAYQADEVFILKASARVSSRVRSRSRVQRTLSLPLT